MNKARRQAAVVDLLQAVYPTPRTTNQLAEQLGFSVRTIERDLADLQSAGANITGTRGRRGGYVFGDDGTVVVVFTHKEASALVDFAVAHRDKRPSKPVRDAIAKIQHEL